MSERTAMFALEIANRLEASGHWKMAAHYFGAAEANATGFKTRERITLRQMQCLHNAKAIGFEL